MAGSSSLAELAITAIGGLGLGSVGAALINRSRSAPADAVKAAAEATKALLEPLTARLDALEKEKAALAARLEVVEAENAHCQRENLVLNRRVDELTQALRGVGLPASAEDLPGSLLIIEKGEATLLKPIPPHRPKRPSKP